MLDNAQTYIGVLATFIVLCLFNNNSSNFLFYTLMEVGDNMMVMMKNHVLALKQDINSIYENKNGITTRISKLLEKAVEEDRKKLLQSVNAIRMQENLFFKDATDIVSHFEDKEKQVKEREELAYIALFSLMLIIIVMLLDCLTFISIEFRSVFALMLLMIGSVYCIVLYKRYLQPEYENNISYNKEVSSERFLKPAKLIMVRGMILTFLAWSLVALFISSTWFALILLPCMFGVGAWCTKRTWIRRCDRYNKYNRIFILKHGAYVSGYALLCAILLELMMPSSLLYDLFSTLGWTKFMDEWSATAEFLCSKTLIKYVSLLFFTLNGFIIPLWLGYLKWNQLVKSTTKELNELQSNRKLKVLEFQADFQTIERRIEANNV
ncbi:MAG: hypothetical protein LUE99_12755 [Bacteroides sp.]|nr:hypothetical protein [Bacteroides sp.]